MYQLTIATPLGELDSQPFNEADKTEISDKLLSNIGALDSFHIVLEDGNDVFMSKAMIGSSVFFLKKIG